MFCELKFEDDGGFFSKKKRNYADEIEGELVRVKEDFMKKIKNPDDLKTPGKNDI